MLMRPRLRLLCERVWQKRRNWSGDSGATSLLFHTLKGGSSIHIWMGFCCMVGFILLFLLGYWGWGWVDLQLHSKGGSLSFSELDQLLAQTLNERFLLLRLQDQQQGHNAVHYTLHIYKWKRKELYLQHNVKSLRVKQLRFDTHTS